MKKNNQTEIISFKVTREEANRIHRAAMFSGNSLADYLHGAVFTAVIDDEDHMNSGNLAEMYATKTPVRGVEFITGRAASNWEHREGLPSAPDWQAI